MNIPTRVEDIPPDVLEYYRAAFAGNRLEWTNDVGLHRLNKEEKIVRLLRRSEFFEQEAFDFSALVFSALGHKFMDVSGGAVDVFAPSDSDKDWARRIMAEIPPKQWISPVGLHNIDVKAKHITLLLRMPGFTKTKFIKNQRSFEAIGVTYEEASDETRQSGLAKVATAIKKDPNFKAKKKKKKK